MKRIVLGLCVVAAACGGEVSTSPTSPTGVLGPARTAGPGGGGDARPRIGMDLPLRGSFTLESTGTVNCPPTCPPTTLQIVGSGRGTASLLGRFTLTSVDNVDIVANTATGTFNLVAADGSELLTTTAGVENELVPPNISHVTLAATIVGGTGRFAAASGAFTIRMISAIDFVANTATASGSLDGAISLNP